MKSVLLLNHGAQADSKMTMGAKSQGSRGRSVILQSTQTQSPPKPHSEQSHPQREASMSALTAHCICTELSSKLTEEGCMMLAQSVREALREAILHLMDLSLLNLVTQRL